jgi:hypothetical protein
MSRAAVRMHPHTQKCNLTKVLEFDAGIYFAGHLRGHERQGFLYFFLLVIMPHI